MFCSFRDPIDDGGGEAAKYEKFCTVPGDIPFGECFRASMQAKKRQKRCQKKFIQAVAARSSARSPRRGGTHPRQHRLRRSCDDGAGPNQASGPDRGRHSTGSRRSEAIPKKRPLCRRRSSRDHAAAAPLPLHVSPLSPRRTSLAFPAASLSAQRLLSPWRSPAKPRHLGAGELGAAQEGAVPSIREKERTECERRLAGRKGETFRQEK